MDLDDDISRKVASSAFVCRSKRTQHRAIALSLQDQSLGKRKGIDVDSDGDDEEAEFQRHLQLALEASKAEASQAAASGPATQTKRASPGPQSRPTATPGPSSFLSQRAQLERERLERQKRLQKHARPLDRVEQESTDEEDEDERPAKRQHLSSSSSFSNSRLKPTKGSQKPREAAPAPEDQIFWNGELRQTATQFAEPRADGLPTFRLSELLGQKSELAFAILSSYALDLPWIYQFFDPSVPVIMVAQPDATGHASIKNVLPHWIRTTPHLRGGFGCQHMKFMLLFYKTGRLRVVVSTANLIAYDWRDMENSVWLQDVSLRSRPIGHESKADDFPATLQRVLHSVNVAPALRAMISDNHPNLPIKSIDELRQRWDWSKVKAHLVPSIAGKHEGWPNVIKTGHPRLMMVVRKMGMRPGKGNRAKTVVLECQGSSLGNFTTQWLNEFHWSARGESAEDWMDESKKRREKLPYPPIKIVFPTKKTVQESALGERGGGTIFCRRKQWSAKNFPRDRFYDSRSKGGPVLMHSKMIIAVFHDNAHASGSTTHESSANSDTEDDSDDEIQVVEPAAGWAYVGSHNFTPSAWGTLSGSSFNPVLNISNYELGIVFPVKDEAEAIRIACWQRPPKKYDTVKDEPWVGGTVIDYYLATIQEESVYHQQEG